jgi:hypothetical protein
MAASSAASSATSSAISMTAVLSGGVGGALIAILLVTLLSSRELISASSIRSKKILATMDAVVIPLLIVFAATVVFQILEIVHPLN